MKTIMALVLTNPALLIGLVFVGAFLVGAGMGMMWEAVKSKIENRKSKNEDNGKD